MTLTTYVCLVLSLSAFALSQVNELTVRRNPGTRINNEFFTVEFVARAIREACDDTGRVCAHISGHRETFTIPSGTKISTDTNYITVNKLEGVGAYIQINDNPPLDGVTSLGRLDVVNGEVVKNRVFTAQFLVTGTSPQLPLASFKNETVVLLNGPVGNERVSFTLAANNDGSGDTFVLTVDPTGVPPAQLLHDLASHRDGDRKKFARNVQLRRAITNGSAAAALKDFCLAVLLIMLTKLFSEI
ncbi:hypothetical protein AAHC03_020906 [Spirometra sp. Aus1]